MCEYKVRVDSFSSDGKRTTYITDDECFTHNKGLYEYNIVDSTTTMFDVEKFRKEELDKLSKKPCEFWPGSYALEPCSEAVKAKLEPHPLSPADYCLYVECDAGHQRKFLLNKLVRDMLSIIESSSYTLVDHILKWYKRCDEISLDERILLEDYENAVNQYGEEPDNQDDEVQTLIDDF